MQQDPLGTTGSFVTPLGLGLAALGRPGYITIGHDDDVGADKSVAALEARCHTMLDAAYAAGLRYFDAARSYGRAEAFFASWLAKHEDRELVVGSKWGYRYTADWQVDAEVHEVKEHSRAQFETQLAETRALLGDRLSLYQVHSATLTSGLFGAPDLIAALADLRDEGVVIGLSLSGTGQAATLQRALEVEHGGARLFGTVQATWNLLEPSVGDTLQVARQGGVGVIIKEALANGRLTDRAAEPALAPLRQTAADLGVGLDALALASAMAQPFADVVLIGAATVEHLQSNLKSLAVSPAAGRAAADRAPRETPEVYWAKRSALTWG